MTGFHGLLQWMFLRVGLLLKVNPLPLYESNAFWKYIILWSDKHYKNVKYLLMMLWNVFYM